MSTNGLNMRKKERKNIINTINIIDATTSFMVLYCWSTEKFYTGGLIWIST